jgi:hypothetical protein
MCVGYQHDREPSVVTDAKKKSIKIVKEESCVALLIVRTSTCSWQQLNELAVKIIKQPKNELLNRRGHELTRTRTVSIYVFIFIFIFLVTTVTGCP